MPRWPRESPAAMSARESTATVPSQDGNSNYVVPPDERGIQSIDRNTPVLTPTNLKPIPASTLAAYPWLRYIPRSAKRDYLPLVTGKKYQDKCFPCWENKIACVVLENKETCAYCHGFTARCNAGRRAPPYRHSTFKKLYLKLQSETIRDAKGQWRPAPTDPRRWVDKVSMENYKTLFNKYGLKVPADIHIDRHGVLRMTAHSREESEDSVQIGATGRRKRRRETIVPSSSSTSSSDEASPPAKSRAPTPSLEVQALNARPESMPVVQHSKHSLSAEEVNALIFPNQSISLTAADLDEEEERIVRLQEMIVPALRKKYSILQTLKAFNGDGDTTLVDRRLPLIDYDAIDDFERGQSRTHRADSVETKSDPIIKKASHRIENQEDTYDEANGSIDPAAVPPWRRPESNTFPLNLRLLGSICL
ncbi:hypothetical protein BCV69DRAFT_179646 [Microstroma glucosiphilum]|uniref:Uncharacterized protein n=1 Tax=Pseudomicrostroma glucosiphilum TaxID=1684307 RepID=A0A316U7Y0_9BASI|nr:hypothetical protein BCV69DRAFT_179646 [Pseudomicrostroma glucosiphilum]PWN20954.1 hypothetical protein BCV69DRAFT_179646 [Pseudomicrostroma glucosiphilum]